jgi:uncharacterized membrane protein
MAGVSGSSGAEMMRVTANIRKSPVLFAARRRTGDRRPDAIGGHMARRRISLMITVAGGLAINPAMAQSTMPSAAQSEAASLSHSALKATTFKVGTAVVNLTLLSYAAGGLAGGAALTTFVTAGSWAIFTVNDYLWDSYAPAPVKQNTAQSFDATSDVWRNTGKYLTYKPVVVSMKLAALYLYTGSASVALVFGTASAAVNTAVFYGNNMAWDYYDWYLAAPAAVIVAKPWRAGPRPDDVTTDPVLPDVHRLEPRAR